MIAARRDALTLPWKQPRSRYDILYGMTGHFSMALGDVTDDGWLVVSVYSDGSAVLVKIPDGETKMGMGRTWEVEGRDKRIVPPHRAPEGTCA